MRRRPPDELVMLDNRFNVFGFYFSDGIKYCYTVAIISTALDILNLVSVVHVGLGTNKYLRGTRFNNII